MMHERRAADGYIRDPECAHDAGCFKVEMPASAELGVIAHFGKDVRSGVGHRGLVCRLKLWTQSGIEGKGVDNFAGAHNLIRVLNAFAPSDFVSSIPHLP